MPTAPVLVVDDDSAILTLVSEVLVDAGYPVETACNGAEALCRLERTRPSVILLDMRMPVLDGWEFAEAIHARGLDVPIVAMTAASDAHRWADEIGAQGCLPKPFELDDLLNEVAKYRQQLGTRPAA